MTTITIRNVPEEVRDILADRAAQDGRSMQGFLLELLSATARTPTKSQLLDRIRRDAASSGSHVTAQSIVDMIREDRDR